MCEVSACPYYRYMRHDSHENDRSLVDLDLTRLSYAFESSAKSVLESFDRMRRYDM